MLLKKLFGMLLFWGLGIWMLQRVQTEIRRGDRRGWVPKGWPIWDTRRDSDPLGFWILVLIDSMIAVGLLIAGLALLIFVNHG
jgi:hypothetical protein